MGVGWCNYIGAGEDRDMLLAQQYHQIMTDPKGFVKDYRRPRSSVKTRPPTSVKTQRFSM